MKTFNKTLLIFGLIVFNNGMGGWNALIEPSSLYNIGWLSIAVLGNIFIIWLSGGFKE